MKPAAIALTVGAGLVGVAALIVRAKVLPPRQKVVQAALGEVGESDAEKYWTDALPGTDDFPKDWCGAFVLWALHQAGLAANVEWKVGRGFLMVEPHALPFTKSPLPGDIAYFDKNQHHAVVSSVYDDGSVDLVNGNGIGGVVATSHAPAGSVTAFFSIEPYLLEAA